MSTLYKMTPGVFIDGTTADAADFTSEFINIEAAFVKTQEEASLKSTQALEDAKKFTDERIAAVNLIDGGSF